MVMLFNLCSLFECYCRVRLSVFCIVSERLRIVNNGLIITCVTRPTNSVIYICVPLNVMIDWATFVIFVSQLLNFTFASKGVLSVLF